MSRAWRQAVLLVGVAIVIVAAGVGWLALRAVAARHHLDAAHAQLVLVRRELSAGDTSAALARLAKVRDEADQAHDEVHDPVWWVAAHVPWAGRPAATTRGLVDAVDGLSRRDLPSLTTVLRDLEPAKLRPKPDTVDVALLRADAAPLASVARDLEHQRRRVAALSPSWLPAVSHVRAELLDQLTPLARAASKAADAATAAPGMLGADGPRRYFVGFQNPAEARGTGGLLGAFAILTADHGRVHVDRIGSDADLPSVRGPLVGLDADYVRRYGPLGATELWVNSNLSPHFPYAAQQWAVMWQQATGQRIDGSLALDPTALAAVLRATGPVTVPGLGSVSASRVAPLIERDEYRMFPDTNQRKKVLVGIAHATVDALLAGRAPARPLLTQLGSAAATGHVLVYSARAAEEAALVDGGVSGVLSPTAGPFAQAVLTDASGTKLDAYVTTSLQYDVTSCGSGGRDVTISVRVANGAPSGGLPAYVDTRGDPHAAGSRPGSTRAYLQVFLTRGAQVTSVTVDGHVRSMAGTSGTLPKTVAYGGSPELVTTGYEQEHPAVGTYLDLLPGSGSTVEVRVHEPAGTRGTPLLPRQPLAQTPSATARLGTCR